MHLEQNVYNTAVNVWTSSNFVRLMFEKVSRKMFSPRKSLEMFYWTRRMRLSKPCWKSFAKSWHFFYKAPEMIVKLFSSRNVFNQSVSLDFEDAFWTILLKIFPQNVDFVSPDVRKLWKEVMFFEESNFFENFSCTLRTHFCGACQIKLAIRLVMFQLVFKNDSFFFCKKSWWCSSGHVNCRLTNLVRIFCQKTEKLLLKNEMTWKKLFFRKKNSVSSWMQFWLAFRKVISRKGENPFLLKIRIGSNFFLDKNVESSSEHLECLFDNPSSFPSDIGRVLQTC